MTLNKPASKSKIAFLLSVDKLFEQHPAVFFWTFTFKAVEPDERAMWLWNQFMRDMKNFFQFMCGLRVVEVHPGEYSHGLHFHALIAPRMNIHIVKQIGRRYGFGRMSVQQADPDSAYYLAKYLSKKSELAKGARRWGTIGGFKGVKVRNIEVDSIFSRNVKRVQEMTNTPQFGIAMAHYIWQQTQLYGDIKDWPTLRCVTPQRAWCKTMKEVEAPDDDGQYYSIAPDPMQPSQLRVKTESGWTTIDPNQKPF